MILLDFCCSGTNREMNIKIVDARMRMMWEKEVFFPPLAIGGASRWAARWQAVPKSFPAKKSPTLISQPEVNCSLICNFFVRVLAGKIGEVCIASVACGLERRITSSWFRLFYTSFIGRKAGLTLKESGTDESMKRDNFPTKFFET